MQAPLFPPRRRLHPNLLPFAFVAHLRVWQQQSFQPEPSFAFRSSRAVYAALPFLRLLHPAEVIRRLVLLVRLCSLLDPPLRHTEATR